VTGLRVCPCWAAPAGQCNQELCGAGWENFKKEKASVMKSREHVELVLYHEKPDRPAGQAFLISKAGIIFPIYD